MLIKMKLKDKPFNLIIYGPKRVEVRLYDKKRQSLSVGDTIQFTSESGNQLNVVVKNIYIFNSFLELFSNLSIDQCGFEGLSPEEAASAMTAYYPVEVSSNHQVVGIEFEITNFE